MLLDRTPKKQPPVSACFTGMVYIRPGGAIRMTTRTYQKM